MKKSKIFLIVFLMIVILLIPSGVINGENTMTLSSTDVRQYTSQNYTVTTPNGSDKSVFKIIKKVNGGYSYEDKLYSLRAGNNSIQTSNTEYAEKFDLKNNAFSVISYFRDSLGCTEMSDIEYNAILWIIDNMYLPEVDSNEAKENLSKKAEIENSELNNDDIEFIQQMAIWYYSNADQNGNEDSLSLVDTYSLGKATKISGNPITDTKSAQVDKLYRYFIDNALLHVADYGTGESRSTSTNVDENNVYKTTAIMWSSKNTNTQPIVKITREEVKNFDLALRTYITKINGAQVSNSRVPNRENNEYKHKKSAIEVSNGDRITYTVSVYNEGKISGNVTSIIDILPKGLEFKENNNSELLNNYKYEYYENERILRILPKEEQNCIFQLNSNGDTNSIDIVLNVTAQKETADNILTNIFTMQYEPTNEEEKNIADIDSSQELNNFFVPGDLNEWKKYSGNGLNKAYLGDENYYYRGQEDDDDFEKAVIKGEPFDLNLKQFITKINGKNITTRIPKVNTSMLNKTDETTGEKIETAEYTTTKEPVIVKKGDIITYTIRVYNEGDLDAFASEISEYIPQGLGYLLDYKKNTENFWKVINDNTTHTMHLIGEDGLYKNKDDIKNLNVNDFESLLTEYTSLDQVEILTGTAKITTTALADKKIEACNSNSELNYQDIEITCIVIAENTYRNNIANIAEISKYKAIDSNNKEIIVDDRDSILDNIVDDQNLTEDDVDYEVVELGNFDLALKEYFSYLISNGTAKEEKDRNPKIVADADGNISYIKNENPGYCENTDIVVYTIKVYNEGSVVGYAKEISHNLPEGLEFLPELEINTTYGWKMYDEEGNQTDDLQAAKEIRTTYLSDKPLSTYDRTQAVTDENPNYQKVLLAFRVNENSTNQDRKIISKAQILKEIAEDASISDSDSIPGEWNENEDDQDTEVINIGKFDFALYMCVKRVIKGENNIIETNLTPYDSQNTETKIMLSRNEIKNNEIKVVYSLMVANQGEVPGYVTEITNYIPDGFEFRQEDNPNWSKTSDNIIKTSKIEDIELQPGDTQIIELVLTWKGGKKNLGKIINIAEISKSYNNKEAKDIDSNENNVVLEGYKQNQEDDAAYSIVTIKQNYGKIIMYVVIGIVALATVTLTIITIKKYKKRK